MQTTDDARTRAIFKLGVQLKTGTAGLDPHDAAVMIVEAPAPDRADWIDLIGEILITHPFVKHGGETCTRVRAIIDPDVLILLGWPVPVMKDAPLASRALPINEAPVLALDGYDREHRSLKAVR